MTAEQARASVGKLARISEGPCAGDQVWLARWESEQPHLIEVRWADQPSDELERYAPGAIFQDAAGVKDVRALFWPVDRLDLDLDARRPGVTR